jgi:hypothetical protein
MSKVDHRNHPKVLEGDVKMECVWNCAGELLLASPVAGCVNQRHRKARQGVKAKKD